MIVIFCIVWSCDCVFCNVKFWSCLVLSNSITLQHSTLSCIRNPEVMERMIINSLPLGAGKHCHFKKPSVFKSLLLSKVFIYFVSVSVCVPQCARGGRKTACESWFSSSTMWVSEIIRIDSKCWVSAETSHQPLHFIVSDETPGNNLWLIIVTLLIPLSGKTVICFLSLFLFWFWVLNQY